MPANDYTLEGRLVGHVVIGRDLLRERCAAIPDFPEELRLQLEHLVLSHQGRLEYGSPVAPMTPEAFVLHAIDDLDSKLAQLEQARASGQETPWIRALGRYVHLAELAEDEADAPPEPPAATADPADDSPEPPVAPAAAEDDLSEQSAEGGRQAPLAGPATRGAADRPRRQPSAYQVYSSIRYSIQYTATPVTDTYSQIGSVQRAMARWRSKRSRSARTRVITARNGTAAASTVWVSRIVRSRPCECRRCPGTAPSPPGSGRSGS